MPPGPTNYGKIYKSLHRKASKSGQVITSKLLQELRQQAKEISARNIEKSTSVTTSASPTTATSAPPPTSYTTVRATKALESARSANLTGSEYRLSRASAETGHLIRLEERNSGKTFPAELKKEIKRDVISKVVTGVPIKTAVSSALVTVSSNPVNTAIMVEPRKKYRLSRASAETGHFLKVEERNSGKTFPVELKKEIKRDVTSKVVSDVPIKTAVSSALVAVSSNPVNTAIMVEPRKKYRLSRASAETGHLIRVKERNSGKTLSGAQKRNKEGRHIKGSYGRAY
jgi:hypothetical protein